MTEQSFNKNLIDSVERLPKIYDPQGTEIRWQKAWEQNGVFHPNSSDPGEPFCIVIPPPNVTGSLHMGHAFNTAIIDAVVRFHRLKGKNVLCLPGTDHASIAVQTILEKQLKAKGKSKDDLGRKSFLEMAWNWKEKSGGHIISQLKRLGYSVDWERERFTLDEKLSKAVTEAFVKLHDEGLIYRGEYLVNWCPESGSAVSDLEVEMKEVDGSLWHFRYPLINSSDDIKQLFVEVATTRPETLLGDVAVAVNPTDDRYKDLIGKQVQVPFVNRSIPIIADQHVDKNFGTGCVKVTPAHDPNDFAIGQRHNLPLITVMNKKGVMNSCAGEFEGLDRFEARRAVIKALSEKKLLVKTEPYKHSVPYSDRGKVPVEPLLSTQWFVRMEIMATKCKENFVEGEPRFIPERWGKVYLDWLENIRDWCISRQLWWGHQIPAWFVISETQDKLIDSTPYVVANSEEEAYKLACQKYGADTRLERDEDVLDTWFSSGLWPFSTLGWPDNSSDDLHRWYPTSTLVTGFDIIFFWVARMTMMASFFTNKMPFRDVYIHGLVRDENNKKMSKSSGNGIDPLLLIDRYGADALRFALIREVAGAGQDIRLDYDRQSDTSATVEASRNFANKLWNATRFTLMNIDPDLIINDIDDIDKSTLRLSDLWILSRLTRLNSEISKRFNQYGLGEAAKGLYEFAWNDLCDWYLEFIKLRLASKDQGNTDSVSDKKNAQKVLLKVLRDLLVMLHPLMPHLTEELWHGITSGTDQQLLAQQTWPTLQDDYLDESLELSFAQLFLAVKIVRNLRVEAGLKPAQNVPIIFVTSKEPLQAILKKCAPEIKSLTRAQSVEVLTPDQFSQKPNMKTLAGVDGDLQVLLPIAGLDLSALTNRLKKDLLKAEEEKCSLNKRLSNKNFIEKAPENVVLECKSKLKEATTQAELVRNRLANLN